MGGGAKKGQRGSTGRSAMSGELGRALLRERGGTGRGAAAEARANAPKGNAPGAHKHTTDIHAEGGGPGAAGGGAARPSLQSVLERNDLDEFLHLAELAQRDFTAERASHHVVVVGDDAEALAARDPAAAAQQKREAETRNRDRLKVPRRPPWSSSWTADQLEASERRHFLEWRRDLAALEDEDHVMLTPFEKNLEVWRQLWRVLERSHIVVQLVDARDPLLYRCTDLEAYVKEIDPDKKVLLLLNKADLLPADLRRRWAAHFEARGVDFLFWSAHDATEALERKPNMLFPGAAAASAAAARPGNDEGKARILNRDELAETLERLAGEAALAMEGEDPREGDDPRRVVAGLVGYPNVGKTSTLNALLGAKKAAASATPGKTKHFQTFNLTDGLMLADCPGLVFPNFSASRAELVAAAVIPIDRLTDIRTPVDLVARRIPRADLTAAYGLPLPKPAAHEPQDRPPSAAEVLWAFCAARGITRNGGLPDETRAGRLILKDFVSGRLLYCFEPPAEGAASERESGFGRATFRAASGSGAAAGAEAERAGDESGASGSGEAGAATAPPPASAGGEELPPDLMHLLKAETAALGAQMAAQPKDKKRADHKFQKKPPKMKGRRKAHLNQDAAEVGGAFLTGKRGGLVPGHVQVQRGVTFVD